MWWIVVIIAVPILLFAISTVLGFTVKPTTTGKALLKKRIKQSGLDPNQIPEAVLDDIAQSAVSVAEMRKSLGNAHFNTALIEHIEGSVQLIGMFLRDEINEFDAKSPLVQKMQITMPHLRGTFKN